VGGSIGAQQGLNRCQAPIIYAPELNNPPTQAPQTPPPALTVHAAVRTQLERTKRACAAASQPRARRSCAGTCTSAVLAQITPTRAAPARAAPSRGGGAAHHSASAHSSSAPISGATSHVIRRTWAAWYAPCSARPTRAKSG